MSKDDDSNAAQPNDGLPGLWIFLLTVLGVLLLFIFSSSIAMKIMQRQRRRSLQRRIAAGEVDLEALGIRRMNVPQRVLDKMPLYTYDKGSCSTTLTTEADPNHAGEPSNSQGMKETPPLKIPSNSRRFLKDRRAPFRKSLTDPFTSSNQHVDSAPQTSPSPIVVSPQETNTASRSRNHNFSQTTCPICIDDFVAGESTVRELPCGHIFHPECIDTFLLQNSSLCPLCKTSVLPRGFIPDKITDLMVRQERFSRRNQGRREDHSDDDDSGYAMTERQSPVVTCAAAESRIQESRSTPRSSTTSLEDAIEQQQVDHPVATQTSLPQSDHISCSSANRQEEMRMRAVAMLGARRMAEDEEREADASRSKCMSLQEP